MRIFYKRRFDVLEDLDCSSAADRGKVFQEDFKRVASFQMLEQDADGHARADEYGGASHDLEV